jgi:nitrite reductase (NADH) large subunit
MSEPLVIIGNGMAAAKLVDDLSARALGRYAVAVIGDEPRLAYNRVLLSSVLAGDAQANDIELKSAGWWRDRGVTVRYGCAANAVDTSRRVVHLADGRDVTFSKLVFAIGSSPLRLNIPGVDLAGVHTFRDTGDVTSLTALAQDRKRVVVIGGGLLGLEAAYGLAKAGAQVTLLHLMDRLMERQLDHAAAALLKSLVEIKGFRVLLQANTARIHGATRVEGIELTDGRKIAADAVVLAAGIRPNAALAQSAGIKVNRGIVVDDQLRTDAEGIYALGECAEHRGICYGLVEPAYEQSRVLAQHLADRDAAYEGSLTATNLKVSGVNVFSAGDFEGQGREQLVLSDPSAGFYKKLVLDDGRLKGAVLVGETSDASWYLELIRNGAPIGTFRNDLIFGRELALAQAA